MDSLAARHKNAIQKSGQHGWRNQVIWTLTQADHDWRWHGEQLPISPYYLHTSMHSLPIPTDGCMVSSANMWAVSPACLPSLAKPQDDKTKTSFFANNVTGTRLCHASLSDRIRRQIEWVDGPLVFLMMGIIASRASSHGLRFQREKSKNVCDRQPHQVGISV